MVAVSSSGWETLMKRREFITLLGTTAAWPLAARAQPASRVIRIGYIGFGSSSQEGSLREAFGQGLHNLGYVEDNDFRIETRFGEGDSDLLLSAANELVRLNVDVIVTYATAVLAAQRATRTIPIVMATYTDAVATGLVASLAHPGGNITGSTFFQPELMAKRLEFLKQAVPSMKQAGVFLFRGGPARTLMLQAMGATAKALGVELRPIELDRLTDLEGAFSMLSEQQISGLVVQDHSYFLINADVIAGLAARHRISSICSPQWAASGGLMGYGVTGYSTSPAKWVWLPAKELPSDSLRSVLLDRSLLRRFPEAPLIWWNNLERIFLAVDDLNCQELLD
jgi:putative tryptophan/tyrosine transport system substrate-binding protein